MHPDALGSQPDAAALHRIRLSSCLTHQRDAARLFLFAEQKIRKRNIYKCEYICPH